MVGICIKRGLTDSIRDMCVLELARHAPEPSCDSGSLIV